MKKIEQEIETLQKAYVYIINQWDRLHKEFFQDHPEGEWPVSNSGLACWIFKHAIETDTIIEDDYWFLLKVIQEQMKKDAQSA